MGTHLQEFPVAEPEDEDGFVTMKEQDKFRFLTARNGDHLMTPFQCDLCHFRNINKRDPIEHKPEDIRLMRCIRRANLDAFWSKEPLTVSKNLSLANKALSISQALGVVNPFPSMGPFPVDDIFGMSAACVMLTRSLDTGKYAPTIQFSTLRKMRGVFTNVFHVSAQGYTSSSVMAKDTRKLMVTESPTYGMFFEAFVRGCHKRMGDIVKPDRALALDVLHCIMRFLEKDWEKARPEGRFKLAKEASFYLIGFCGALRGEEIPMADLNGLMKHWDTAMSHPTRPHVPLALMGRFKNEIGEKYHYMPLASTTKSGLQVGLWIGRLLEEYLKLGITSGPLFRSDDGFPIRAGTMEESFFARLEKVQDERPDLIGPDTIVSEEYGIYRSARRGATSEATNRGVRPEVIDANNRWRKVERAQGKLPSSSMQAHYTDARLIIDQLLIFSSNL